MTVYDEIAAMFEEVDDMLGADATFRGEALTVIASQVDVPTMMRDSGYEKQTKLSIAVRKTLLDSIPLHDEKITIEGVIYTIRDVLEDETHYQFSVYLPA